jgi:hypothetical protein
MGVSNISAIEAIRFLRTASDPNARFYIDGEKPDLNFRGIVSFTTKDGWILQAYWSNGFFNYVDSLTAPWGSTGTRTQWHEDDGVPNHLEDLLTEQEFGWLCWSLMAAESAETSGDSERISHPTVSSLQQDALRETHLFH